MAFSIKIYEKDKYMYALMKARIGALYPEAYITDPYLEARSDTDGTCSVNIPRYCLIRNSSAKTS